MTIEEYNKLKNGTYQEAVKYFLNKYGPVPFKYPSDKNHEGIGKGLFVHHIKEDKIASLCVRENIKMYPEYQQPEQLVYVDYLEHVLLHLLIGKETAAITNLGLHGLERFLLPALRNYFNFGIENYRHEYYEKIENELELYKIMFSEYNILIEQIDTVLDTNIVLYENMYDMLETQNKCLVVLGTGLGKTSTALQYIRDKGCRALVIGPNNTIKGKRPDENDKGNGWLKNSDVEAITYQSFSESYDSIPYEKYGLVILDEAHHAGFDEDKEKGALLWGKAVKYLFDNNIKVLGLTATPIRSDGIDIGQTVFNNCVCEGYTIEEGITLGIIHPFSFITSIYDTEGIKNQTKALLKKVDLTDVETVQLIGEMNVRLQNIPSVRATLHKYLDNKGRRKGIVFVSSIEKIQEAMDIIKKTFPQAKCKQLHSNMSENEKKDVRDWFIEEKKDIKDLDKDKYLFAVDMISEGAHYTGVNTLIMFRTTQSYLVYSQQLGRAVTLKKYLDPHTVVFDLVNNIENISYNSRKVKDKKQYSKPNPNMLDALRSTEAFESGQIIVENITRDFVESMNKLKEIYSIKEYEPEEDAVLYKYYETCGAKKCQQYLPNRTLLSIYDRAAVLDLKCCLENMLTDEQKTYIEKNYFRLGPKKIGDEFGIPYQRISLYAKSKNLKYDRKTWKPWEDSIIRKYYPVQDWETLLILLAHRTKLAICARATAIKCVVNEKYRYSSNKGENHPRSRQIICIETQEIYKSSAELYEKTGIKGIASCVCKKNVEAVLKGYHWAYLDDTERIQALSKYISKPPVKSPKRCKIKCIETGQIFRTVAEAASYFKVVGETIRGCLTGKGKTACGYHWEYVEE